MRGSVSARPLHTAHGERAEALPSSTPPVLAYDYGLVTTRAGFDALESEWNDLFDRAGSGQQMFQTFNWLWHWANHFLPETPGGKLSLFIVTARQAGRLVLVWPLVKTKAGAAHQLRWMGEPVSQYGDVLIDKTCDNADVLKGAWQHLREHAGASVLQLNKVRADSHVAALLTNLRAQTANETTAPYLDLSSAKSYDDYETRYSSGTRRNRGRQRRRLAERGAITLEWHTSGPRTAALVSQAFDLKRAWLQSRGIISPALADPRTKQFFLDVTCASKHPAGCHVAALHCADKPVALEIGVQCRDRTAIHIIAYDLDFEKTAAGALLFEDSIRHAYDEGCSVYDLLAPGDSYKMKWADDAVAIADWSVPLNSLGWLYANVYTAALRPFAKRVVNALPASIRRAIAAKLMSKRV